MTDAKPVVPAGDAEGDPEWFVYVLASQAITATYVGITIDVERRLQQHNGSQPGGARSTRRGRPWQIRAVSGPIATRGAALQLEYRIKAVTGSERYELVCELGNGRRLPAD
ncbi:MAG: putative endonuclease [Hyphomicrobiaceae bacterium]|jgi:putative endonuclease